MSETPPENINREPFLVKLWAAAGKVFLPTLFSARTDTESRRSRAIIRGAGATEILAIGAMFLGNPILGAIGYGASRMIALLTESIDQKRKK